MECTLVLRHEVKGVLPFAEKIIVRRGFVLENRTRSRGCAATSRITSVSGRSMVLVKFSMAFGRSAGMPEVWVSKSRTVGWRGGILSPPECATWIPRNSGRCLSTGPSRESFPDSKRSIAPIAVMGLLRTAHQRWRPLGVAVSFRDQRIPQSFETRRGSSERLRLQHTGVFRS